VITHPDLLEEVTVSAVAHVTTKPVLRISKSTSSKTIPRGNKLRYTITVLNLGQQATDVVLRDTIPANTTYVPGSGSAGVQFIDGQVKWVIPILKPGESLSVSFDVEVNDGTEVVNSDYWVTCEEGVTAYGVPVITPITGDRYLFMPLILK